MPRVIRNHQIKAEEIRLIDDEGENRGVVPLSEGLKRAEEAGKDLIQVTPPEVSPPVCKVMEYGKYVYDQQKKEKKQKQKTPEMKGIRLRYNISEHDMATRVKAAVKFLEKGHKVKAEMLLRGREKAKYLRDHAEGRMQEFLNMVKEEVSVKVEQDVKRDGRGLTMILSKSADE